MPTSAPFHAFAYLDIDHPVVAWGAYRGFLVSAHAEARPPQVPVSMMLAGMIQHQNNARLHNELLIEGVRVGRSPDQVPRLTGMYFFTDVVQASAALAWGGHFRPENLVEVEVHPVRPPSKVDANWITYAERDAAGRIHPTKTDWIELESRPAINRSGKPSWMAEPSSLGLKSVSVRMRMSHAHFRTLWIRLK